MPNETYVCVDVETAGPTPGQYALLSIGACLTDDPAISFYVELKPDRAAALPEALAISGLVPEKLARTGREPREALLVFETWLAAVVPAGSRPVFVALNAPFDWMFMADYFQRYLGRNPFGHSALDIKALYMGAAAVAWGETSMKAISTRLLGAEKRLVHNALQDARDQAEIFNEVLKCSRAARR